MASRTRARLVALNAALAVGVAFLAMHRLAGAQPAADRGRGAYTMIAGKSNGGPIPLVHVVDGVNQEMLTLRWEGARGGYVPSGYRDLRADAGGAPSPR